MIEYSGCNCGCKKNIIVHTKSNMGEIMSKTKYPFNQDKKIKDKQKINIKFITSKKSKINPY